MVPENGAKIDTDTVKEQVEAQLARFKHPRVYVTMDALPRNTMGKVMKNVLSSEYQN